MKETFWCGEGPKVCQICDRPITDSFVDGKTQWDCWAFMCKDCWEMHGEGLGLGKGQIYGRQQDGRWLKLEWRKIPLPTEGEYSGLTREEIARRDGIDPTTH
jgi:hypothetical protein